MGITKTGIFGKFNLPFPDACFVLAADRPFVTLRPVKALLASWVIPLWQRQYREQEVRGFA
jgi:hypothetical protein